MFPNVAPSLNQPFISEAKGFARKNDAVSDKALEKKDSKLLMKPFQNPIRAARRSNTKTTMSTMFINNSFSGV